MVVLIGKGRRLTIREIQTVAYSDDGTLQWQSSTGVTPTTDGKENEDSKATEIDVSAALAQLSLNTSDDTTTNLSNPESIAFLTLLAQSVAQGYVLRENNELIASTLVEIVVQSKRNGTKFVLPSNPVERIQATLTALIGVQTVIPTSAIDRALTLSTTALQVTRSIDLASAALPIAAITIDSVGLASKLTETAFTETAFDVLRPHRSMVTAAASLRALLNDSRFNATETVTDGDAVASLRDLPQYHGPALEDIKSAAKRLELELNGSPSTSETILDPTVITLVQQQLSNALLVLLKGSSERIQVSSGATETAAIESLPLGGLVQALDASLSQEATLAVSKINDADTKAAEAAREKEAQKEAAASAHAAGGAPAAGGKDEFAGMSEAQIAKILKKRAEKEAKAAEKRKAKEQKGVSLFGAGTQPVCQILVASKAEAASDEIVLTIKTIQDLVSLQEKLLSGGVQRKPKIPKGTRDYLPEQMMIRQQAFDIIRRVFQSHGAVEIDTPVFELKDTLTGKYGEDSKLIYDLADQGGELLALRYDLTVPFARFLALNSVGNIKRFHIGKVYRRDQPALKRGRYREFYQCDFDIAGTYGRMVPDSECICVACDILYNLPIGDFAIKLNHRRLLDAILDICGVPAEKFRTICSAVDKLDKEPWSEVKREMVEDKGLTESVADKIGEFVLNKGQPFELYKELMDAKRFGNHKGAMEAMEDLRILFDYLEAFDKLKFVSFDLSLARGLDYYTGVIYEAVCMNGNTQVGSIGGGGRYDRLVGMFQDAGKETPCVGVSIGIERVFTLMEERLKNEKGGSLSQTNVNVLIASAREGMMVEKMRIARILWEASISAEFSQQENAKLKKELVNVLDRGIPFMIIIGEDELKENKVTVKNVNAIQEEKVPIAELVKYLRSKGVVPVGCEFAAEILKKENADSTS